MHMMLNWRWIKQVAFSIFNRKILLRARIAYALNIFLLVSFSFIIISGILISMTIFVNIKADNPYLVGRLHVAVSYLTLGLLGIHVGLHRKWIAGIFTKIFSYKEKKKTLTYAVNTALILVFVFGIYQIYSTDYFYNVSMIIRSSQKENLFKDGKLAPSTKVISKELPPDSISKQQLIKEGIIIQDKNNPEPGKGQIKYALKDNRSDLNIWNVLASYLSIMAVFAVITGCMDKLRVIRR